MSVEFQEEDNLNSGNMYVEPVPKFAKWLISKGLAKDEDGANRLEIIVAVVFFLLAIYFFF